MKAALWDAIGHITITEVPVPEIEDDEVLIKVAYCGICGNDAAIINADFPPYGANKPPMIPGHEFVGTIVEAGKKCIKYKPGMRVASNMQVFCHVCDHCHDAQEHFCENKGLATGAYAEYAKVKESALELLPDEVSFERAALTEPFSAALHCMDRAGMVSGKKVAIIGAGEFGQMLTMLAVRHGAAYIMVLDKLEYRREAAIKNGADLAADPADCDDAFYSEASHGHGFDYVFETTGKTDGIKLSMDLAAACGTVMWGWSDPRVDEVTVSHFMVRVAKELTIKGAIQSPYTFHRAVSMLPKYPLEELVTDVYPLSKFPEALKKQTEGNSMKIIIKPD